MTDHLEDASWSSSGKRTGRVAHRSPAATAAPIAIMIAIIASQIPASELVPLEPLLVSVEAVEVPDFTISTALVGPGWVGPVSADTAPRASTGPFHGLTSPSA